MNLVATETTSTQRDKPRGTFHRKASQWKIRIYRLCSNYRGGHVTIENRSGHNAQGSPAFKGNNRRLHPAIGR
jgi:hypothetical protein